MDLKRRGNQVAVLIGGKPFATYYFGPEAPKPYLHPLRSAQGIVVTRGFPMRKDIPSEGTDHPHHRALYFAHGDVNGVDFWTEAAFEEKAPVQVGGKQYFAAGGLPKGRTVFRKLEKMKSRAESGTVRALFDLVGPDGKAIAQETQAYVFRGDASTRTIDCEFTVRALAVPVKMGDTKEGTFAIRVVKALEEPNVRMLNSEGAAGEKQIWGKRAKWVDYSGTVGGAKLGIAIFDNPSNPKHPTYWHARGYGLFAVNPFGEHDFYNDPKRDGSITIPAGGSLTFRYRVFIHNGDAAEAKVADAYDRYAASKWRLTRRPSSDLALDRTICPMLVSSGSHFAQRPCNPRGSLFARCSQPPAHGATSVTNMSSSWSAAVAHLSDLAVEEGQQRSH